MLMGHKVRLYPTAAQRLALGVTFGCARWIYNEALTLCAQTYQQTGTQPSYHQLQNDFFIQAKCDHPWLKEANSQSLQVALQHLTAAFDAFFAKKAGYPRIKRKRGTQSASYYARAYIGERRATGWGTVRIPKVGLIKAKIHRPVVGTVRHITVSLDTAGRYWASIIVQNGIEPPPVAGASDLVGVDLGLRHFATLSTGEKIENPRYLRRAEDNLRRKNRKLARKQKGSKNREKARQRLARAHARVADARRHFLHTLSRRLVNENQGIAVETLSIKQMMQSNRTAKSVADAGWHRFIAMLAYKAAAAGKPLIQVGRFYPSTKTCSVCQTIATAVPRGATEWACSGCDTMHDRDLNAARNIRTEGLRLMAEVRPATASGRSRRRWAQSRLAQRRSKEEEHERFSPSGKPNALS